MRTFIEWLLKESDDQGMLLALQADPTDRVSWLAYADWLSEQGDPLEQLLRALFNNATPAPESLVPVDDLFTHAPQPLRLLLQRAFVEQFDIVNRFGCSMSAGFEIHQLMAHGYRARAASEVLDRVNELLDGHGVEVVRCENHFDHYWADACAAYVNMGDTYDLTVLYDTVEWEWMMTDLGTFVEERGDDYGVI